VIIRKALWGGKYFGEEGEEIDYAPRTPALQSFNGQEDPVKIFVCVFVFALTTTALLAQPQRTFVSAANGSDSNPCSRQLPCRNFATAVAAVVDGGEVVVLDSGGYGPVSINHSVSLISPSGVYAGITATSSSTAAVSISTGSNNGHIVVRGLSMTGLGAAYGVIIGPLSPQVHVESCIISGFAGGISDQSFRELFVLDSIIRSGGSGIVGLSAGTLARLTIDSCRIEDNSNEAVHLVAATKTTVRNTLAAGNGSGFSVEGTDAGGVAEVTIDNSAAVQNGGDGVLVQGTNGTAEVNMDHCRLSHNGRGLLAGSGVNQQSAIVRMSNCSITNNGIGVEQVNGGIIYSRGDNTLEGNGSGNTFMFGYSPK
jgi:parallel beta helix pectate lyase-like protein